MLISITKNNHRNTLLCTRADGSTTQADLGPDFPYHDIAHYVTEQCMGFRNAFFGLVDAGQSIEALSTTDVIRGLPRQAMVAEVLTRALQSLSSGACRPDQYIELVSAELGADTPHLTAQMVQDMHSRFMALFDEWNQLTDGGSLQMNFTTTTTAA